MITKPTLTLAAIFSSIITISSCSFLQNCEEGTGNIVEKEIILDRFSEIEVSGNVKVFLSQGPEQKVTIKAEENLIPLLKTDINGDEWDIEFTRCVKSNNDIQIFIQVAELSKIDIEGSGSVKSETILSNDKLYLEIDGSGSMDLMLAVKELKTRIAGSGDIKLNGNTKLHEIEINGSGDVDSYELKSDETEVEINGSGDVKVNVSYALDVEINGSGDVYYRGEVKDMKSSINGSGKLHQEE